jgi:hypothetical protein
VGKPKTVETVPPDGAKAEQQAGRREFKHEVLEDCLLNGIYRTKGDIIFSQEKKVPHCSVIE